MISTPLIAPVTTDQSTSLLQTMLDGSINAIILLEPMLDAAQKITDFRILAANRVLKEMTGVDPATVVGQPLITVYPGYKTGGFFQIYCDVLADGQVRRAEHYYEDTNLSGWFEVSVVKEGNGLVLTFANTTATKEVNMAVQQATDYLQSVIDFAQTGIAVICPVMDATGELIDFRFKSTNRLVAGLVGKTPDSIRGTAVSDWFASYRQTGVFEYFKQTYNTSEPQRFDINYNVDGFDVWFDVQCIRKADDVLLTFSDYTQLKQAQQAIEWQAARNQQQANLLNSILDSSDSGIIAFEAIRDPNQQNQIVDFRFLMANEACVAIVGKPMKQMIGRTLLRVFPGNRESGLFDAYCRTTETGEPFRTETYYKYDKLDFWLSISAQKLGDGFVVTFADISAFRRATEIAKQSTQQLQTVIDTAQTGIFLFVPVYSERGEVIDFRFETANRQLAGYVGQEPSAVVGKLGSQLFPDYKNNGLFERYRHTYETGEALRFDFHYCGDGIDAWLDILSTKTDNAVLVTFSDFTALKQLQQQLENSVADLQRSNENLQQFAYVASHDLQEPLRKMQAFGDMLKTTYAGSLGNGADLVNRMQAAAGRMSSLIRDLLTYSRLSTNNDTMKPVNLANVLAQVTDDLDLVIAETGAKIIAEQLPTVPGDSFQLQQLFQNLLSNALKFRQSGIDPVIRVYSVTVTLDNLPEEVKPLRRVPAYRAISVADNGIGFDDRYRERIFQVFQRLHGKQKYAGTGIGLAIVQKVADNHGGAVSAHGQFGKGATFTVYLPA